MREEEKFESLKRVALKRYSDYINAIQKTSINDLNDWNTRKRLIDTFVLSVEANTVFRDFIAQYAMIQHRENK